MKPTTNSEKYTRSGRSAVLDGAISILFGVALGLVVLINTAEYGDVFPQLSVEYLRHWPVIWLNVLPVAMASFALWLLLGRVWLSSLITGTILLLSSFGNYFKIYFRGDPFVAADLTILREVRNISGRYPIVFTKWMWLESVAAGVFVLALLTRDIVRRKRARKAVTENGNEAGKRSDPNGKQPKKGRRGLALAIRLILFVCVAAVGILTVFPLYNNEVMYCKTDLADEEEYLQRYNPADAFVSHGFVFSFLRSAYRSIERPVAGYSEDLVKEILGRYTAADIPEDEKIDVICVMLEAFSDLSVYDEIDFAEDIDVYEVWHRISEEGISGRLITNVFAAGTINTERNFLTGYDTTNSDYYSEATSLVRYFKSQGYEVTGSHPGEDWFYNRRNINKWLGFDSYYFIQNRYEGISEDRIISDAVFFPDLWKQYEERDTSKPYFNFSVTYQNHAPYSTESGPATHYISDTQFAGEEDGAAYANILNNYLNGIYYTNIEIGKFVDRVREAEEPVVLVFFGDHKPWLGGGNSVYNALGINIDLGTEEGMLNYYSTSYVIWANDAAKAKLGAGLSEKALAERFSGDGGDTAPYFLMLKMFDMLGWEGPQLMQLERDFVREEALAVNRETEFYILADGSFAKDPGEEVLAREREILYCQYYLKHKNIYAAE